MNSVRKKKSQKKKTKKEKKTKKASNDKKKATDGDNSKPAKGKKKAAKGKNAKAGKKSSGPKTKGDAFLKRLKRDLKKTGGEKLCSITYDEETDSLVVGLFQRNKAKTLYVDVEE